MVSEPGVCEREREGEGEGERERAVFDLLLQILGKNAKYAI
jgi:hypothetical protein